MVSQQLIDYIKQNKSSYSVDQLKQGLMGQGYSKQDVDQAADIAEGKAPPLMQQQSPPPMVQQQTSSNKMNNATSDPKFKETLKIFVIFGVIFGAIRFIFSMFSSAFTYGIWFSGFDVITMVMVIVYAAIGGAIGGAIFYFIYDWIKNLVQKSGFLSKYITNLFKLFWIPALWGFIITAIFAIIGFMAIGSNPFARGLLAISGALGGASFGKLVIGTIITLVGNLLASYIYAKRISASLSQYYPW